MMPEKKVRLIESIKSNILHNSSIKNPEYADELARKWVRSIFLQDKEKLN